MPRLRWTRGRSRQGRRGARPACARPRSPRPRRRKWRRTRVRCPARMGRGTSRVRPSAIQRAAHQPGHHQHQQEGVVAGQRGQHLRPEGAGAGRIPWRRSSASPARSAPPPTRSTATSKRRVLPAATVPARKLPVGPAEDGEPGREQQQGQVRRHRAQPAASASAAKPASARQIVAAIPSPAISPNGSSPSCRPTPGTGCRPVAARWRAGARSAGRLRARNARRGWPAARARRHRPA